MITRGDLRNDEQGAHYVDLLEEEAYLASIDYLNREGMAPRLVAAALLGLPALDGVVAELERIPVVYRFLSTSSIDESRHFRQGLGVLVRMHMEQNGWRRTGRTRRLQNARFLHMSRIYEPVDA